MNYDEKKQNMSDDICKNINSYIWEKQNYFFELGHIREIFTS